MERTITRAWATSTSPSLRASRVAANIPSRDRASSRSACAAERSCRVRSATQAAVEVAADSAATSEESAATSTRIRRPASRASARARSTSRARCSAAVIDHAGTSANPSSTWCRRAPNRARGCAAADSGPVDMSRFSRGRQ